MMSKETEAEVLRLFNVEKWRRHTIAKQLGLHHSAVERALRRNCVGASAQHVRTRKIDAFLPFIKQTLDKYPKLNGTRLYHMVKERGYTGQIDHFRALVKDLRPKPIAEAFLRLSTLPGYIHHLSWLIENFPAEQNLRYLPITKEMPYFTQIKMFWERALLVNPKDVAVVINAAQFYQFSDLDSAEALWKQALDLDPDNGDYYRQLSNLHLFFADSSDKDFRQRHLRWSVSFFSKGLTSSKNSSKDTLPKNDFNRQIQTFIDLANQLDMSVESKLFNEFV